MWTRRIHPVPAIQYAHAGSSFSGHPWNLASYATRMLMAVMVAKAEPGEPSAATPVPVGDRIIRPVAAAAPVHRSSHRMSPVRSAPDPRRTVPVGGWVGVGVSPFT